MANDSPAQATPPAKPADAAAAKPADAAPDAVKMTPSQWSDRSRTTFDVSPHALAGALFGVEADAQLTEDEVRSKLDEFSVRKAL